MRFIEFLVWTFSFLYILKYLQTYYRRRKQNLPPGPKGLPIVGYLPFIGPQPPNKISELSKIYGPLISVWFGSQHVVFVNDIDLMREMGKMDVFMGRNQLEIIKPYREKCGLIFQEGACWVEWRRFVLKTLKEMGYGKIHMISLIQGQVEEICDLFRANLGKPICIKGPMEIASVNTLWEILTGEHFDLEDPHKRLVLDIIADGVSSQEMMGLVVFLPWLAKLIPNISGYNQALKVLGPPCEMIRETLKRHEEQHCPGNERDFIDVALTKIYRTQDAASFFYKEVGMRNLEYTLLDLLFTGFDTSSSTLCWAFLYMAMYPEKQRKVQREIDEVVGQYHRPCIEDRPRMPYTEATIMEVMRKSPLVQLGAMHTALEDTQFHGYDFPKRTVIMFNLYGVMHDPKLWDEPDEFRPERFIAEDGSLRKNENLIPFFVGKRSCPGETLAWCQMFLFFTGVLHAFNLQLANPEAEIYTGPTAALGLKPPLEKLIITGREGRRNSA